MSYEEFKNIVSLLQSPDEEVVELGRQLFPKPPDDTCSDIKIWLNLCMEVELTCFYAYNIF